MLNCGLLGRHLLHSYSPQIHAMLYPYSYVLFEKEPEEVSAFLREGEWDGLNVTIPYKKEAYTAMDILGRDASRAKSVNTIVHLPDGSLFGDSTDVYGFSEMVKHSGIQVRGKKAVVLGSGGASLAVVAALQDLDAGNIVVVSRRAEEAKSSFSHLAGPQKKEASCCRTASDQETASEEALPAEIAFCGYEDFALFQDADLLINATPVGMYPENGASAVDLERFSHLAGVLDLIYNPCRTALLLQAEQLGIPYENGLYMLVAQAKKSAEIFTGEALSDGLIDGIYRKLYEELQNIALIGMPGVGKTTIARMLHEKTGRAFYDTDDEITMRCGLTPRELIETRGEDAFRRIETEVLADVSKRSHAIIATGGGIVTRKENYPLLHQNSRIIWLKRDISALPTKNRPLSQFGPLQNLYDVRRPMYEAFSDESADLNSKEDVSRLISRFGTKDGKEQA